MKIYLISSVFVLFQSVYFSQDITGKWYGLLKVNKIEVRIDMNIVRTEGGYVSTMDSPDQGALGVFVDTTEFKNPDFRFKIVKGGIEFRGEYTAKNTIKGLFFQRGMSIPLEFGREEFGYSEDLGAELNRKPQEPFKPYSYYTEEVTFLNKKDKVMLSGTLTLPTKYGKYPVVVLISGSGPQNRDGEVLGHKPFLVLSDYLTRNGIGVLRYDDRGVGKSTGVFKGATSFDFSKDVEAAVVFLKSRKEIDKKNIGLIGHSEGGAIAPMVAARLKEVDFIVLLAGPGISGGETLLIQQELIGRSQGVTEEKLQEIRKMNQGAYAVMEANKDTSLLKSQIKDYYQNILQDVEMAELYAEQLSGRWMQYFITYDPRTSLEKVKCPVLALNGLKDIQVPSRVNLEAIRSVLENSGNVSVTIKEFPSMNHLFQECVTGNLEEYATIEETMSPIVLQVIEKWIKNR